MYPSSRKFQTDIDRTKARRQREHHTLSLRRKDRELTLQKKRKKYLNNTSNNTPTTTNAPPPSPNHNNNYNDNNNHFNLNSKDYKEFQSSFAHFNRYVEGCFSQNKTAQFECTQKIRKLLSFANADICNFAIKAVIDCGVIPRIIQFLNFYDRPQLQYEALWVITNVASSSINEYVAIVVKNGAIPIFIQILKNSNLYSVKQQSIWALANIAGDCVELRDMILTYNILPILGSICKSNYNKNYIHNWKGENQRQPPQGQYIELMEMLSWCLSNLCRYENKNEQYVQQLLYCLCSMLINNDENLKNETIDHDIGWGFFYLMMRQSCDIENKLVTFMNDNGITQRLINKLKNNDYGHISPILKAIGNMLTGNDLYTQKCIDFGLLPIYYKLLASLLPKLRKTSSDWQHIKEICWSLSNICAGTLQQNNAVLVNGLFPFLIDILEKGKYVTAKEALWALSNASQIGNKEIMLYLAERGFIKAICSFLQRFVQDKYTKSLDQIIEITITALANIFKFDDEMGNQYTIEFEENNGLDVFEDLQAEDEMPQGLYELIVGLLQENFPNEDEHDFDENKNSFDISYNNNNNNNNDENGNNNINNNNNNDGSRIFDNQFGFGTINLNNDDKQFEF